MRKYFSRNYVIPSNAVRWKLKSFCLRNQVETKQKKRSSPQFGTMFGRNLWDLVVLTDPFSSDHPALKSRWGDAKSLIGETLTLDGGDASPLQFKYCLLTTQHYCHGRLLVVDVDQSMTWCVSSFAKESTSLTNNGI